MISTCGASNMRLTTYTMCISTAQKLTKLLKHGEKYDRIVSEACNCMLLGGAKEDMHVFRSDVQCAACSWAQHTPRSEPGSLFTGV